MATRAKDVTEFGFVQLCDWDALLKRQAEAEEREKEEREREAEERKAREAEASTSAAAAPQGAERPVTAAERAKEMKKSASMKLKGMSGKWKSGEWKPAVFKSKKETPSADGQPTTVQRACLLRVLFTRGRFFITLGDSTAVTDTATIGRQRRSQ